MTTTATNWPDPPYGGAWLRQPDGSLQLAEEAATPAPASTPAPAPEETPPAEPATTAPPPEPEPATETPEE